MNAINKPIKIAVTTGPLQASRKLYLSGEREPSIRVPMREIALDPSAGEPPVAVYDTSGPYTDPLAEIDIHRGLPAPARAVDQRPRRRRSLRRPHAQARG